MIHPTTYRHLELGDLIMKKHLFILSIFLMLCSLLAACTDQETQTESPSPPVPTETSVELYPTEAEPTIESTEQETEPPEIVYTQIKIDGDPDDWEHYDILITDPEGDHQGGGFDVSTVKAILNDTYLYVLIDTHSDRHDYAQVDLELMSGDRQFVVSFRPEEGGFANMGEVTTGEWVTIGEVNNSQSADGEAVEFKMPLSALDYTTKLTLLMVRPMAGVGGEDWYAVDETSSTEIQQVNELEPSEVEMVSLTEQPRVCDLELVSPIPFGGFEPAPLQFSQSGYSAEWFIAPGQFNMPHEIMLSPQGELLVLSVRSQKLFRLSQEGEATLLAERIEGYLGDVDGEGNTFLYDYPGGQIVKVTPNGLKSFIVKSSQIQAACDSGFAIGPDGNMYIALNTCGPDADLIQVTLQGKISTVAEGIHSMSVLGTTPDGRLLGAEDKIYEISLEDFSITSLDISIKASVSAGGMTFDDRGNIYLSTGSRAPSGTVYQVDRDGKVIVLSEIENNGLSGIEWLPSTGEIVGGQLRRGGVIAVGEDGQVREIVPGNGIITPMGMAFSPCGELAVANDEGEMMTLIDPAGYVSLLFTYNSFTPPTSFVAFAPDGTLYTTEGAPGMPERISMLIPGETLKQLQKASMPCGIVYRSDGTIFLSETSAGRITQINPDGSTEVFTDGLIYPQDLVLDSEDNIYVVTGPTNFTPEGVFNTPNDGDTIMRITPEGAVTILVSMQGLTSLAIDSMDQLFASAGGYVSRISPNGEISPFSEGLTFIRGMAFDLAGYLYLADADLNGIARIGGFKQGVLSGVITDDTGVPVEGVRVQVISTHPIIVGQVVFTDAEGHFSLPAAPRSYEVIAMKEGFETATFENIDVYADQEITIEITLGESSQ
jgi:sugar lactone lactonase YvrE